MWVSHFSSFPHFASDSLFYSLYSYPAPSFLLLCLSVQASEKSPSNASPRPSVENERLYRCQGNASRQAERVKGKSLIVTFCHFIEDHVNQDVSPSPARSIAARAREREIIKVAEESRARFNL